MQRLRQARQTQLDWARALAWSAASTACCMCIAAFGPKWAFPSVLAWLLALAACAWLALAIRAQPPFSFPGPVGWGEAMTLMLTSSCIWVAQAVWL
jgi:hypothetical protein